MNVSHQKLLHLFKQRGKAIKHLEREKREQNKLIEALKEKGLSLFLDQDDKIIGFSFNFKTTMEFKLDE